MMFTATFWQDLLVRAVKTLAQVLAALLVANGTGLLDTDWGQALSIAGMAALVSALTTLASGAATGSPAAGEAVTPDPLVAAYDNGGALVAGRATPIPDGTPVVVTTVG